MQTQATPRIFRAQFENTSKLQGVTEVREREKDYLKMLAWWSEKKKFILHAIYKQ